MRYFDLLSCCLVDNTDDIVRMVVVVALRYNLLSCRVYIDQRSTDFFARYPESVAFVVDLAFDWIDAEERLDLAPSQEPLGSSEPAQYSLGIFSLSWRRILEYADNYPLVPGLKTYMSAIITLGWCYFSMHAQLTLSPFRLGKSLAPALV